MNEKRIVIFGMGALSKMLTVHAKKNTRIVAYLLTGTSGEVDGVPIISLKDLTRVEFDYIVVAFGNTAKGIDILVEAGVQRNKIVGYACSGMTYEDNFLQQELDHTAHEILQDEKIPELFDIPQKRFFLCSMNVLEDREVIKKDFVREQTLAFLAEEIYRRKVEGSVAEIGVSSGEFAQKINALFPDRKLYLFDTYEGLIPAEKKKAIALGWGERQYALDEKGTPTEEVLQNMPYANNCIIKKGYFPDTFDIQEKFAFLSLDIDFYESIKRGLEMIYPHLSKGGYIMVHDFHNLSYVESREAIINFCDENGVSYVPIPDTGGSVVIVK